MYINNTQNIFLGGAPAPQFGSGCCGGCTTGGVDPMQLLGSMQSLAGSVMGMGFMGGGGLMAGGFAPGMCPGFGGVGGMNPGDKATKKLAKAINDLTKFLGKQSKAGKGKKKKKTARA